VAGVPSLAHDGAAYYWLSRLHRDESSDDRHRNRRAPRYRLSNTAKKNARWPGAAVTSENDVINVMLRNICGNRARWLPIFERSVDVDTLFSGGLARSLEDVRTPLANLLAILVTVEESLVPVQRGSIELNDV